MSFGFSVGDFIAALELVGSVVASLRESGGATSQFRELTRELFALETALLRVKQLDFDQAQYADYVALRQVACQCQQTIDALWTKASRYQRHLLSDGSIFDIKAKWMKIKWCLIKADEVARFKADVAAHTQSILLLLAAFQMKQLHLQGAATRSSLGTLTSSIQQGVQQCYEKLSAISNAVGGGLVQAQEILHNTTRIFQTNLQIFQIVRHLQLTCSQMPAQVDRQQPVYLIDALGKVSPFHLEFVRSANAFKSVLQANFENVPSGLRKIQNGEFIVQDSATGRVIDLSRDWDTCFLPGQRVDMRILFQWNTRNWRLCPACRHSCDGQKESDIECQSCGLVFKRSVKTKNLLALDAAPTKANVKQYALLLGDTKDAIHHEQQPVPPRTAFDETEDMKFFRRVHIIEQDRVQPWLRTSDETSPLTLQDLKLEQPEYPNSEGRMLLDDTHDVDVEIATVPRPENPDAPSELRDVIELPILESILEMDDDDEREFTRIIVIGGLKELEKNFRRISTPVFNDEVLDMDEICNLGHFIKGSAYTVGLTKISGVNEQIQLCRNEWFQREVLHTELKTDEDYRRFLQSQCNKFYDLHEKARIKLQSFYRVTNDDYEEKY